MLSDTRLNPDYLVQNEADLRGFFPQTHQIARTGNDQRIDAIPIRLRTFGVLDRVPTHHITLFSSV